MSTQEREIWRRKANFSMVPAALSDDARADAPRVVLYSRPVCPLCDEVKPTVLSVAAEFGLRVEPRDVEANPEWEARFGTQIPVAFLGATKLFKYRVSEAELRQRIQRALGA